MNRTDQEHWKGGMKVQGIGICLQTARFLKAIRKAVLLCEACNYLLQLPVIFWVAVQCVCSDTTSILCRTISWLPSQQDKLIPIAHNSLEA